MSRQEPVALDQDRASDLEQKIAELKRRWPAHSVPAGMWQELEELEEELKAIKETEDKSEDGGETGAGRP